MFNCYSDRWDPTGSDYDSIDQFIDMCYEVFGETPELQQCGSLSLWYDGDELVLASDDYCTCELCDGSGKQNATLKCSLCEGRGLRNFQMGAAQ